MCGADSNVVQERSLSKDQIKCCPNLCDSRTVCVSYKPAYLGVCVCTL